MPLVKVVTGIRRCGKSTLLSLFEKHLSDSGVSAEFIIRMNFESFEYDDIVSYKELHEAIKRKMDKPSEKYYILLDEVQQVESW